MSLRQFRPFLLLATLFTVAMFVLEHVNGRFWLSDFKVYWGAADALLHGRSVYGMPFGEDTGFYKYSPFVAMLFVPLALLPFSVASIVWYGCIAAALIGVILLLHRELYSVLPGASANRVMSLALLCVGVHVVRELHLGNVNLVVLLLAALAYRNRDRRPWVAGALLALLFLVKPYLGLLFVPFAVQQRWNILSAAAISGVLMVLVPCAAFGEPGIQLHRDWLQSMAEHGDYLASNNTVSAWLARFTPLDNGPGLQLSLIALAAAALALIAWRERNSPDGSSPYLLFFGPLALIPNLVITDTQHFLLSLPLFLFALDRLPVPSKPLFTVCFVATCLLHGANSSDLLGHELSGALDTWGIIGLANMLLIGLCIALQRTKAAIGT